IARGVGGLCLWVALDRPVATATATAAARLGVRLSPGTAFGADGVDERHIRIPFTLPSAQLTEAIALVGQAYRQAVGGPQPAVPPADDLVV
ncbi:MAG: hypothetical protein QM638_20025, partial [Nocardioides sp.]